VIARDYEPWTGEHVVIDTAHRSVETGVIKLHALLLTRERRRSLGERGSPSTRNTLSVRLRVDDAQKSVFQEKAR